jgi:hypothetical protein
VRVYAFDLLAGDGVDMRDETLQIRKLWLGKLLQGRQLVKLPCNVDQQSGIPAGRAPMPLWSVEDVEPVLLSEDNAEPTVLLVSEGNVEPTVLLGFEGGAVPTVLR